jgi:hypothetical protein
LAYPSNNLLQVEEAYFRKSQELPVRLFATMGTGEDKEYMLSPFFKFIGRLESRGYGGLEVVTMTGHNEIHQTSPMNLMPWVLMKVFPPGP